MPKDLKVLLPVSLVLLFSILLGQSGNNTDLLHDQIDSLFNKEKYHEAFALIYPELEKSRQTENWKEVAYLSYYAAVAKTSLSQYDTCGLILEKDLQLFRAHQYTSHDVGDLYSFLGLNNVNLENYPAALDAYKEAISIFESLKEVGNSITFCNHNIAQIYLRRDDFPKAIFYLESALRTDTSGESHAATYGQLANCYHYMGDEKRVMEYCRKGFAVPHLTDIDKANLQSIAFTAWVAEGKMEEARKMLGEALAVYPKTRSFAIARIRVMTNLGVIYFKKGLIPQSDKIFATAELEGKSYYQSKSREMAKLYVEWGDLYKKQGDNDRAMKYYHQALIQSWPDFNNPDIAHNPVGQHPPIELWAMNAASRKAALLITQNKVTVADRIKAADCFDLAFAVAAQLRKVYERDETKLYFQQNNYNLRVEAVKNLWAIYSSPECVSKEEYLYRVFDLFESDRAATLRDALVRNNAMSQSGLPDSLRQQEENLRRDLALVQQKLKDAEVANDTAKIEKFRKLSFSQQREYDALLFRL